MDGPKAVGGRWVADDAGVWNDGKPDRLECRSVNAGNFVPRDAAVDVAGCSAFARRQPCCRFYKVAGGLAQGALNEVRVCGAESVFGTPWGGGRTGHLPERRCRPLRNKARPAMTLAHRQ